ncbi:class I SAM-dependent methyltransferase [Billgrantia endophytica]|nr:rRNA adenine N-6-methyltransferase family protein [Halomonas endophytica]
MGRNMHLADTVGFFKAWLIDPRRVAAIVPSGRALASLITSEISARTGPVIELGPGTGVFTRALIERGVAQENLALIEYDATFAARLERRFERAHTVCMDAARLKKAELFEGMQAGAVISGLPLLSMPPRKVMAILDGVFARLRSDGALYQFTYGPNCPIPRALLDRLGLKALRIGHTFANVPPASVYRIVRRPPRYEAVRLVQGTQPSAVDAVDRERDRHA